MKSSAPALIPFVTSVVERLAAASSIASIAQSAIPRLVSAGVTSESNAATILSQITAINSSIAEQVGVIERLMEQIQDGVEIIGQFLLLHRDGLVPGQADEIERLLALVKS